MVETRQGASFQCSVNTEQALGPVQPAIRQWDYTIGWLSASGNECCCFIQVHPTSTGEMAAIIAKKRDLEQWLKSNAQPVLSLAARSSSHLRRSLRHWLATSGHVVIAPTSTHARRLAQAGIHRPARHLALE